MGFHLRLIMPSDPRILSVARAAVSEMGAICGFPEESRQGIILAIDEGLANIIRHAYKGRHDQEMELDCQADDKSIVFRLRDQGETPDPDRICGQPLDDFSLSGRGTHLMKAIMDDMCYEQADGKNQLRLVKHLPAAKVDIAGEGSGPHG